MTAHLSRGLRAAAAEHGDRPALLIDDTRLSFAELDARCDAFAALLAARGVVAGQRIAVMTANRPEFIAAVHGITRLGGAAVLISPAWKSREVGHALEVTGASRAVGDGDSVGVLNALLGEAAVVNVDDPKVAAAVEDLRMWQEFAPHTEDDESVLVFSSGTTGLPKAVRHTHASMERATIHWVRSLGLRSHDRFQVATPPSHILGLLNLLAAAEAGASVRLHRRFDLDEILRRIHTEKMTLEMAVAPIALAMANHPNIEQYDLSSLRYILWGATPVTPSVAERVTARTGVRWLCGYGASEVPVIAVNPVDRPDEWRLDSCGIPATGVRLRVVDLESGRVLPPGETGEVQVLAESVMAGYLPAEANGDAFSADGWYRTGDVGWLEEQGWVHLTDRSKEMIKVKGFQVAPAEIEAVLHGHPGVSDCAVFGIPHNEAGEVPVAAVTLVPGEDVSPAELQKLVADSLAGYKRLQEVRVVADIPRLPSGKVLRRLLRDSW